MSVSTDRAKSRLLQAIGYANRERGFAEAEKAETERRFITAVKTLAERGVAHHLARTELAEYLRSLCPTCGCLKDDHGPEHTDPLAKVGNFCYDCGRVEGCEEF